MAPPSRAACIAQVTAVCFSVCGVPCTPAFSQTLRHAVLIDATRPRPFQVPCPPTGSGNCKGFCRYGHGLTERRLSSAPDARVRGLRERPRVTNRGATSAPLLCDRICPAALGTVASGAAPPFRTAATAGAPSPDGAGPETPPFAPGLPPWKQMPDQFSDAFLSASILRQAATLRLCSSNVAAKACPPVPSATKNR